MTATAAPIAPAEVAVDLQDVTKSFGSTEVIRPTTLSFESGQIFGLIGPSGCGKTTLVRLLVGLSAPTSGIVRVLGVEPRSFSPREREQIGYVPQEFFLYPTLSVWGNALFAGALYGLGPLERRRRAREVLEFLEIWDARKRLARQVSGGMQRRLLLACALLHRPRLLVVDEPTAGLDPVLRAKIWGHLKTLRDQGVTIFMTTQLLDEATTCDRIAVMDAGEIIALGTPEELREQSTSRDTLFVEGDRFDNADIAALWRLPSVLRVEWRQAGALHLLVDDMPLAIAEVTQTLHERKAAVTSVRPYIPSFDEVFLQLVRR